MSRYTPPEPLRPTHDLAGFDSGNDALNRWLVSRAVRNQDSGASRTFVTTCDGLDVGYYAPVSYTHLTLPTSDLV